MLPRINTPFNAARFARTFRSSARVQNAVYGTPKSGPYSNLPFKVKDRKFIPFGVAYWGVLGTFFLFPFLSTYLHMVKSGSFEMD